MKTPVPTPNRRQFIRQSACGALGLTGIINTIAHLKLINGALAQGAPLPGYKALVVIFLYGGNDSNNTLIPQLTHPEYAHYKSARANLTIYDPADAVPTGAPTSLALTTPDGAYGIHPDMGQVQNVFNTVGGGGTPDLAFVANVGTLTQPILDRDDYINGTVDVPPQLFSHSDQQLQWQSSVPDRPFTSGWGGRAADFLFPETTGPVSLCISLSGINSFQVGNEVPQYSVSPTGAISLSGYGANYSSAIDANGYRLTRVDGVRLKAFEDVMKYTHAHLLEESYDDVVRRARSAEGALGAVIAAGDAEATAKGLDLNAVFGTGTTGMIGQLKMIARLIAGRGATAGRQIFFCSVSGYDTHASQLDAHSTLMTELSASLGAFNSAMKTLQVNDNVLAITHSDFTRTLTPNSDDPATAGSDHGWGGHHIVMGGAVKGGRIYGAFPPLLVNAGLDVNASRGRWIPTTAVDQYAAIAARWFGDNTLPLDVIFPNLGRFPSIDSSPANLLYL